MNYVKIGLEEYNNLKKSEEALREKKILRVSYSGNEKHPYSYYESYCTESEVIADLTKRINELENINKGLMLKINGIKKVDIDTRERGFWDFLK